MYLFYTPDIDKQCVLSEEESAHCVRVLRYNVGDEILLTDGKGKTYHAKITNAHPKHCEFTILSAEQQQKNHSFHLHIAVAPTKNIERIEWMVEKCTEIGVDEITFLDCRYSERRQVRMDRMQKIILSAAKQSLTPYLPKLNEMTQYETFVNSHASASGQCFIAHCIETEKKLLKEEIQKGQDVLVLIGPEGDFSEEEISMALALGFVPVSLGKSRLRTETAGVVACHTAVLVNEE